VFAHNEDRTIGAAVSGFLHQEALHANVIEVIVVCCACTDETVKIAMALAATDDRVRVVERSIRAGKVAAINEFIAAATGDVLVISGADVIPTYAVVDGLIQPMIIDPACGMTGPRIVGAIDDQARLSSRLHSLLWYLHHEIAARHPKLGETIAVRRSVIGEALPTAIHCDEVLIESVVTANGGCLTYVASASVSNFPPKNLRMLYSQRRRIACQHRAAIEHLEYRPSTTKLINLVRAACSVVRRLPGEVSTLALLGVVEIAARAHGRLDHWRGSSYDIWQTVDRLVPGRAESTQLLTASGRKGK
jgi:hypothetical protein